MNDGPHRRAYDEVTRQEFNELAQDYHAHSANLISLTDAVSRLEAKMEALPADLALAVAKVLDDKLAPLLAPTLTGVKRHG